MVGLEQTTAVSEEVFLLEVNIFKRNVYLTFGSKYKRHTIQ